MTKLAWGSLKIPAQQIAYLQLCWQTAYTGHQKVVSVHSCQVFLPVESVENQSLLYQWLDQTSSFTTPSLTSLLTSMHGWELTIHTRIFTLARVRAHSCCASAPAHGTCMCCQSWLVLQRSRGHASRAAEVARITAEGLMMGLEETSHFLRCSRCSDPAAACVLGPLPLQ